MSAAEPVRPATVDAFYAAFGPSGLGPAVQCPAYGLAEHTGGWPTFRSAYVPVCHFCWEPLNLYPP